MRNGANFARQLRQNKKKQKRPRKKLGTNTIVDPSFRCTRRGPAKSAAAAAVQAKDGRCECRKNVIGPASISTGREYVHQARARTPHQSQPRETTASLPCIKIKDKASGRMDAATHLLRIFFRVFVSSCFRVFRGTPLLKTRRGYPPDGDTAPGGRME